MIKAVRALVLLSMALYMACLTQDAFCYFNDRVICVKSLEALLAGFLNALWWSNPLLFLGWVALWIRADRWLAFAWCAASLAIAPWHLLVELHTNGWTGGTMVSHEAGYWLWLASMGVALVASLLLPRKKQLRTALGATAPEAQGDFDHQTSRH